MAGNGRRLEPDERERLVAIARQLRVDGWSTPRIGAELGVSAPAAWRWVRDLPRKRGRSDKSDVRKHTDDAPQPEQEQPTPQPEQPVEPPTDERGTQQQGRAPVNADGSYAG